MFWKIFNHLATQTKESYSESEMVTLLYLFDAGNSLEMFAYFQERFLPTIIDSKMEDNFESVYKLTSVLVKH